MELVRAAATAHAHEKVQQWLEKNNKHSLEQEGGTYGSARRPQISLI